MSREGLVATLWMHQAEMGMWDSFQGQFLFLQENSKSDIMLSSAGIHEDLVQPGSFQQLCQCVVVLL